MVSLAGGAASIAELLGEPADHPLDQIDVTWVQDEEPGLVSA
ncbi:hypothetical protein [Streptomyces sp. NPDC059957]